MGCGCHSGARFPRGVVCQGLILALAYPEGAVYPAIIRRPNKKKKKKNSYAPIFTGPRYTIYHIPHYTSLYIHWVFKVSGQQICIKNIVISRQPLLYLHTPIYLRSYRRNPHIRNVSYSIVKAILLKFILWDSLHTYVATFLGNY